VSAVGQILESDYPQLDSYEIPPGHSSVGRLIGFFRRSPYIGEVCLDVDGDYSIAQEGLGGKLEAIHGFDACLFV